MAAPACEPRVRVAAVLLHQGRIVLVRHEHSGAIYHLLPGGGVEMGETLEQALAREVREETGLLCRIAAPLLVSDTIWPDASRHVVNITFHAEVTGGELCDTPLDPRVVGHDLVEPGELSSLDLRPPIARELAEAVRAGFTGPARYLGPLWAEGRP